MEELSLFLGFMPALITVIVTMAVVSSFLREVVFDRLTEMVTPVAAAAGVVAASAAVVGAFGFPAFVTFLLVLVAASAAIGDREVPAIVVVEEYLDDADADDMRRQLATALARAALAAARIKELEGAYKPTELGQDNLQLQEMFKLLQAGRAVAGPAEAHA